MRRDGWLARIRECVLCRFVFHVTLTLTVPDANFVLEKALPPGIRLLETRDLLEKVPRRKHKTFLPLPDAAMHPCSIALPF